MHTPVNESTFAGGPRRVYEFPNGLGASVVSNRYTYGGAQGLYELAVLDSNGDLIYDTPITSDVIGWLTEDEVQETLDRIAALTAESIILAKVERERAKSEERIAELREELARLEAE